MCVKPPSGDLNSSPCSPYPTNTYICEVTITLRMCGGHSFLFRRCFICQTHDLSPSFFFFSFFLFFFEEGLVTFLVNNAAQKCEIKLYLRLKFCQALCHANNAVVKNRPRILQSP